MPKKDKIFEKLDRTALLMPAPTYWLDTNNTIIGGNDLCLEAIGSQGKNIKEVLVGKTYYDYYPKYIADELTTMINRVLENNKPTKTEEKIVDVTTGKLRYYETARAPLFSDNGKMVGTICTAVEITAKKEAAEMLIPLLSTSQNTLNCIKMSNRELECVKLLAKGFSSKQIAAILNISNRTVEQYIDTAKNKLSCKNSVELIYKCFKSGLVR